MKEEAMKGYILYGKKLDQFKRDFDLDCSSIIIKMHNGKYSYSIDGSNFILSKDYMLILTSRALQVFNI